MRRGILLSALLVLAPLVGCVGADDPPIDEQAGTSDEANPWERGLNETFPTPEHAPTSSRDGRRADVSPPGAPAFAAFDALIEDFMATHQIPAGAVAVMRGGQLRYENGYGHADPAATQPVAPDSLFRIASVTKPMTAAVIGMLMDEGRFSVDDPVFCVPPEPAPDCRLPIEPHPKRPIVDERVRDVTVGDLIDHRTGWDRASCSPDWGGQPIEIAALFDIPSPPPTWRMMQYVMGEPMVFDPGTEPPEDVDNYCNAGYKMLGLIAEATTGATMSALHEAYLFRPLELTGEIEAGRTLPEDRNPREVSYACDYGLVPNVYAPDELVCYPDGGFNMESFVASGGLVATPAAVATVYHHYRNDGTRDDGEATITTQSHTGGLPGTATTARRYTETEVGLVGDVEIVVFFNKQTGPSLADEQVPGAPYEFQLTMATLLAAYVSAEDRLGL